jgi:type IV pilus assembly protein PilE
MSRATPRADRTGCHGGGDRRKGKVVLEIAERRDCAVRPPGTVSRRGWPWVPSTTGGFTLIELMIVVVIAAILAAVAYPNYMDQVRKTHRASARAALSDAAARQEQYFLDNKVYADDVAADLGLSATVDDGAYVLSVADATAGCPINRCYVLQATPKGFQEDDVCGTLTRSSDGDRTPPACWDH